MERDLVRFIAFLFAVLISGPTFAQGFGSRTGGWQVDFEYCNWKHKAPISIETKAFYYNGSPFDLPVPIPEENLNPKNPQSFDFYTKETSTRWLMTDATNVLTNVGIKNYIGPIIVELTQYETIDIQFGGTTQSISCHMHLY